MGNIELNIQIHSPKMKLFTLAVIACVAAYALAGTCAAANYCLSCSAANVCTRCHNWGSGSLGARYLASNACANALANANVTTTDIKFYAGDFTVSNTVAVTWSGAMCDGSKHWRATSHTNPVKGACIDKPSAVTEIADCKYRSIDQTASATYVAYCTLCDKGKAGNAAYTSCSGSAMSNCDYQSGTDCYYCKTDYAVNFTGSPLTCVSYTTDNNCRVLLSAGVCGTCWDAYYFNGTTCKLFAKIFAAGLMLAASIFFY